MSSYIKQPGSDKVAILDGLLPVAGAATTTTGWINANQAHNYLISCSAGTVGTSVDCKIEQASDNTGTGAKDISGLAITQLTAAGSALINLVQGDFDLDNDFNHFRASLTTVGASTVAGVLVSALDAQYEPLSQGSIIDEIVS